LSWESIATLAQTGGPEVVRGAWRGSPPPSTIGRGGRSVGVVAGIADIAGIAGSLQLFPPERTSTPPRSSGGQLGPDRQLARLVSRMAGVGSAPPANVRDLARTVGKVDSAPGPPPAPGPPGRRRRIPPGCRNEGPPGSPSRSPSGRAPRRAPGTANKLLIGESRRSRPKITGRASRALEAGRWPKEVC